MCARKPWRTTVAGALLFLCGCGQSVVAPNQATPPQTAAVHSERVTATRVNDTHEAVGTTRSKTTSTIQSRVLGHVLEVHVTEGSEVASGQLLVEVDARDPQAQLEQAESNHAAVLQSAQEIAESIRAAASARDAADANLALAKTTFERQERLVATGAVSRQTFDEAEARYKSAAAEAKAAEDTLKSIQAREGEITSRIKSAAAGVELARVALGFTQIVAPFDGVITAKTVDAGDLVSPGVPLLEVEDSRHYRLEIPVDEALGTSIQVGTSVHTRIDSLDTVPLEGTVSEVVPRVDPSTRTFLVKIDLPFQPGLRSGLFGRAVFPGPDVETILIPRSAILEQGQLTGVYAIDAAGIARLRLIKTGREIADRVEVLSGLNEGEAIVVDPIEAISDGVRVGLP